MRISTHRLRDCEKTHRGTREGREYQIGLGTPIRFLPGRAKGPTRGALHDRIKFLIDSKFRVHSAHSVRETLLSSMADSLLNRDLESFQREATHVFGDIVQLHKLPELSMVSVIPPKSYGWYRYSTSRSFLPVLHFYTCTINTCSVVSTA